MTQKSPIAVVGMAGLFPGALDLDTFWHHIIHKISAAKEIPASRWIPELYHPHGPKAHPDKAYSTRACLLDDYRLKPGEVNLDDDLLKQLDPLHHLVLGAGKAALETCMLSSIENHRMGICLAAIALPTLGANRITAAILEAALEKKLFPTALNKDPLSLNRCKGGRVIGYPAAILAKAFDMQGSAFTLDAACASSLYAVKIACDELLAHKADAMIAGGVSRPDNIFTQVGFSQLRALSPSGRCAAFDETADGLVVGEGAGLLVLKRLEDALTHGDTIHGLITGIGLSNDMSGNLLAPDMEGQTRAMKAAYQAANWQPTDVDLIECHGAGTPVGDMVELKALHELWKGRKKADNRPCAIGSIKSVVGHLLTGAGAAGMIKTLLAFQHKTLPPSTHFNRPPKNSLLHNSPFKVLSSPEPWVTQNSQTPRRAAVSAFGFGGINAHVLLEEWVPENTGKRFFVPKTNRDTPSVISVKELDAPEVPMAIVGMGAAFGNLGSLKEFQEAVFKGTPAMTRPPANRWKGSNAHVADQYGLEELSGAFVSHITVDPGRFHIPPNEIKDMLPQQLFMLEIAAAALTDAGLPLRGKRPAMGAIIGIGFDFETTNFYLRWNLLNKIRQWNTAFHLNLKPEAMTAWCESLMDALSPPLTAARTLGNLGSIVASRVAREFQFGGPSYTVSSEEASGLTALDLAITALAQGEVDAMLVGAVDFSGDVRHVIGQNLLHPFSPSGRVRPFDRSADGTLPGEGAVALVIKRLEDAIADDSRIYAVIKGTGQSGSGKAGERFSHAYVRSLENTFSKTDISPASVGLIETHGMGHPFQDRVEAEALNHFLTNAPEACTKAAMGATKPIVGHTGAASGLVSLLKTVLCLYQEIIPPMANYTAPMDTWAKDRVHIPGFCQYWVRNRKDGPRRALAGAVTLDGACHHVLLEEMTYSNARPASAHTKIRMAMERKKPLGWQNNGLFVVNGKNSQDLIRHLDALATFVTNPHASALPMEALAAKWYHAHLHSGVKDATVSIVTGTVEEILAWVEKAKQHVADDRPSSINGRSGFGFAPRAMGPLGKIAFVYPGSGNHYLGMGRDLAVHWSEIFRTMDRQTLRLKDQMLPEYYVPWRVNWEDGWEKDAEKQIAADAKIMIFGQVAHGDAVTRVVNAFDVFPRAVIGYSLGQSIGYFATHAWPDKGEMLTRIAESDLFTTQLAGPCDAARTAWLVPEDQAVEWTAAVVNRPANAVRQAIRPDTTARLLIVNTYEQCVIGGRKPHVQDLITALDCDAVFLEGVVTVHCDAANPVADAYRDLHVFPVTVPENITYYSCADGKAHFLTSQSAADSICRQATRGFDFTQTVESAYADGVRVFLEMGPHASCTAMIRSILKNRPHVAVSACFRGENDHLSILKFLGALVSEHIPVNLDHLYGTPADLETLTSAQKFNAPGITLSVGSTMPHPGPVPQEVFHAAPFPEPEQTIWKAGPEPALSPSHPVFDFIRQVPEIAKATALAHDQFLAFSEALQKNYARTIDMHARLLMGMTGETPVPPVAFTREDCLEFATGSAAKVLGSDFAVVDTYEKRVRLPDAPLMLVDRIISIEGEKGSLQAGRIVTEHDVVQGAWYLDGGKAPVCISVEAGQADLFLCAYLGIDHAVRGKRAYRLLDATVEFHQGLPEPGDVIRYDIHINRFVRQGETYLFFFNFTGYIGNTPLITMTDGCAGFFTDQEVANSGGIIIKEKDRLPLPGLAHGQTTWIHFEKKSISDKGLFGLRNGDPAACFGPDFAGISLPRNLWLPTGPMKLIDRVLEMDPRGGRYGLGRIITEADIHPDDWFLTCHFQDDMVMPGTLMYQCCDHTLRVLLMHMGWVTDNPAACFEPVIGIKSVLKCRGPVTPRTRHVHYEVEIKEIGCNPEPYALADAHMSADGHRIVLFTDMSIQLSHVTETDLRRFWQSRTRTQDPASPVPDQTVVFTRSQLEEFALGRPSKAFGAPYAPFDGKRFIARLPNPPLLLMDRVVHCEPEPWVVKPGGWIETVFDITEKDWYFAANRTHALPHVILLEIALQPCGWLAAYMGSALKMTKDLKFRNLDGKATLYREILQENNLLTVRARCTRVSTAGDMIIEQFDFSVNDKTTVVYEGDTTFGFFTHAAMAAQKGIPNIMDRIDPDAKRPHGAMPYAALVAEAPVNPEDAAKAGLDGWHKDHGFAENGLVLPAKALLMVDFIDTWLPKGGAFGLGFVRGIKTVDPSEWFFKAHFYQDPVCPGSLGIESFLQLLKFAAIQRWGEKCGRHHFEMVIGSTHQWTYRGQIVPENKTVTIEAVITKITEDPFPTIYADGYLRVDGKYIYEMKNYGICIQPNQE